jgi:SAM-dependent methyltransferase
VDAVALNTTIGPYMRIAPPYTRLAPAYNAAFGIPFFLGARLSFETLVRHYRIQFRSAADLGCGTGLFARYLARRWAVPAFGVDRSEGMLLEAARHCCQGDVRLLCQDIRRLELPFLVDLVTANFDTFNHLLTRADLCAALRRVAHNLRRSGHLIFDFMTDCQPFRQQRVCGQRSYGGAGVGQLIRWDATRKMLYISVVVGSTRGGPSTAEHHTERAYAPVEMARCLFDAGFRIRGVHDATTLRPAERCSPRVIVVAQKCCELGDRSALVQHIRREPTC